MYISYCPRKERVQYCDWDGYPRRGGLPGFGSNPNGRGAEMSVGIHPIFSLRDLRSLLFLLPILLLLLIGCGDNDDGTGVVAATDRGDCVGCHTSKDMLVATTAPDTSSGGDETGET